MNTNKAYDGLTHPCIQQSDGTFLSDLKYRYLQEDVPTGLCFAKGVAELLGQKTPTIDKVMLWAQGCIGFEILVGEAGDAKCAGKDIGKTRAPQGMGIKTIDEFFKLSKINVSGGYGGGGSGDGCFAFIMG